MAAPVSHSKAKILQLYRQILRTGQSWEGPHEEKMYIFQESRTRFNERKDVTEDALLSKLIQEGEERLEYARHYKIPYPRLRHSNQFPKRYFMQSPGEDASGSEATPSDSAGNLKLEAAMQRRKAVRFLTTGHKD